MNDVRRRREIQAEAAGLQRQNEKRHSLILLELTYQILPPFHLCFAMQDQTMTPKDRLQERRQRRDGLAELREQEELLLARRDGFRDFTKPEELAAVAFGPIVLAEPL